MARVLLFGRLGDIAGWRERTIAPAPARLSDLRDAMTRMDARLGEAIAAPEIQVAVNQTIVRGDLALPDGCEVAFMPPMSGG